MQMFAKVTWIETKGNLVTTVIGVVLIASSFALQSCTSTRVVQDQGQLVCCSSSSDGEIGNDVSGNGRMSAEGRYVVFDSIASNLVTKSPGQGNDGTSIFQVYRKDLTTGEIVCCSVRPDGEVGNWDSRVPDISADGRVVVFISQARNFSDISDDREDVYLKDMLSGELLNCSVTSEGVRGNAGSYDVSICENGRYVVFSSNSTNLTSNKMNMDGFNRSIFRKDLETGEVICCSTAKGGEPGDGDCGEPCISSDGRYVTFSSGASNLVDGGGRGKIEVYQKDILTDEIVCCSTSAEGERGNQDCDSPSVSASGRFITFRSDSDNLVSKDTNKKWDIFRKDLDTGEIVCCSTSAAGKIGDDDCTSPSIDGAGRYVAFTSKSGNLISGDDNGSLDVFRKDLDTGEIVCCSASSSGELGKSKSAGASISANGQIVSFSSWAHNLIPEKIRSVVNVFVKYVSNSTFPD